MFPALMKLATVVLMAVEATTTSTIPVTPRIDLHPVEKAIVDGTNAQRALYGLPALQIDMSLEQTARNHAAWMTNSHNLQHSSIGVAENIAWGQRSAEEAMSSWMSSSGHRANILNPSYRRIGVAAYTATDGSCYWCQQFLQ
ncbi:MAG TPA: CAP domain-containing protein [Pirellulales bacterium]|jgi:uncharacterized protein YkwD|nr:CAP domain-containing protein [Pirellulales bacterium]